MGEDVCTFHFILSLTALRVITVAQNLNMLNGETLPKMRTRAGEPLHVSHSFR